MSTRLLRRSVRATAGLRQGMSPPSASRQGMNPPKYAAAAAPASARGVGDAAHRLDDKFHAAEFTRSTPDVGAIGCVSRVTKSALTPDCSRHRFAPPIAGWDQGTMTALVHRMRSFHAAHFRAADATDGLESPHFSVFEKCSDTGLLPARFHER